MSAIINQRAGSSRAPSSIGLDAKPNLLDKIEGHQGRVNGLVLLVKEEGLWTISDDRTVRLYLKRDSGQYWPSIHHTMPVAPTTILFNEQTFRLYVGLLNGNVYEFNVSDDYNSMEEKRKWMNHAGPVSGLALAIEQEQFFTCSKDRSLMWYCSETGQKAGSYHCENSCTALVVKAPIVFIGDHGGNVVVMRVVDNSPQFVSKLSAHTGPITSLSFDRESEHLYSGSCDNLVIMWDIGGQRGQAYELNGHSSKVTQLATAAGRKRLFSADDAGKLVIWDMSVRRMETPAWKTSDVCEICNSPFFWNVTAMWQRKVVGLRQHHCRTCGIAVCSSCCSNTTVYPKMGYELPVRICKNCHQKLQESPDDYDLTPLAVTHDLRSGLTAMDLQETTGRLATVGHNRVIMIWDVKPLF